MLCVFAKFLNFGSLSAAERLLRLVEVPRIPNFGLGFTRHMRRVHNVGNGEHDTPAEDPKIESVFE